MRCVWDHMLGRARAADPSSAAAGSGTGPHANGPGGESFGHATDPSAGPEPAAGAGPEPAAAGGTVPNGGGHLDSGPLDLDDILVVLDWLLGEVVRPFRPCVCVCVCVCDCVCVCVSFQIFASVQVGDG